MSKNTDRYTDHLENYGEEDLLDLDTSSFERFHTKKDKKSSGKGMKKDQPDYTKEDSDK